MIRALPRFAALIVFIPLLALSAHSQAVTKFIGTGSQPIAAAVNPVTNKIYVPNSGSNTVTVIDGSSSLTTTVAAGNTPIAVAVNPVTNKIYVANIYDDSVTEIDGATNATTTIPVGSRPIALAVNSVTNKIYVANFNAGSLSVINGATNATSTIATGSQPRAVAVNPVTGTVYVANAGSNSVTTIGGTVTRTVAVGEYPFSLAVNPVTDLIYIANRDSNTVTVLNGSTKATTTVAVGTRPVAVALNPVTNQIYVANYLSFDLTVIDGATNATTSVPGQFSPIALAVNTTTNQIFVANQMYGTYGPNFGPFTVIDGATNAVTALVTGQPGVGFVPAAVAVNPVTNRAYFPDVAQDNLVVVDGPIQATAIPGYSRSYYAAQNPVTNKSYFTNSSANTVSVLDGTSGTVSTISTGAGPTYVAVNPVTDKIYISNDTANSVTEIDDATGVVHTIAGVSGQMAVNPVTDKIYVANFNGSNVGVIDGATNAVIYISLPLSPRFLAVNPATNKIYVSYDYSYADEPGITVIDGATQALTNLLPGTAWESVAVNPVTNKIYSVIGNSLGGTVLVIDGETNATTQLPIPAYPTYTYSLAIDDVLNKIYVANYSSLDVAVIDGATNNVSTFSTPGFVTGVILNQASGNIYVSWSNTTPYQGEGAGLTVYDSAGESYRYNFGMEEPWVPAVNPATNVAYTPSDNGFAKLSEQAPDSGPLTVAISPLANNATSVATPTFSFKATSTFAPHDTIPSGVLFQVDSWEGPWTAATNEGSGNFKATTAALLPGFHFIYAYATDGQLATSTITGTQTSPMIGRIAAYGFLVLPAE